MHKHKSRLNQLDTLGAGLSFACALHCALQPLLLAMLPLMGLGFLLDERLETLFLAGAIVLASATVISGWRHHRQPQALPVMALAAVIVMMSRFPALETYEMPLAVIGALGIMSSHLLNLWLHKRYHLHHQLDGIQTGHEAHSSSVLAPETVVS